ncbi:MULTISPECIES: glutamine synthetase family protein [unclassified Rhizobium]|mgnify:CR=1 FL=1|jgi:glutamine synthetase|uniref:glutamine synthetase family protein n=1 Tax=unclassified Rhizobium TaxID=2613769 RepID=UPI000646FD96|nr:MULTISPECIES: glutamine synthetase family protein [unclassified Rhizobium]MBN8954502.1 glutamine synthetase [Rhizobium tropici]OJY66718.1 MAG: glutamine synthetase [Rhizobium sp. 60-20]RKD72753.1 L-glutamine synthetase [Rhizobium sp. WW_1]
MSDNSNGKATSDLMELATFVTTDIAGITRGRSFAAAEIDSYLRKGVGWVPANLALTPFDLIADPNPWGSSGDLRLMADPDSKARVTCLPDVTPLHFYHSDITNLKGEPWECCVRSFLKATISEFEREAGLKVVAAVEQEFQLLGVDWPAAPSFGLRAQRRAEPFGPLLMTALKEAGAEPEMFLPEYGKDQFEITCRPAPALAAADRGATIRAVTKEVAALFGWNASFAPKTDPNGVGNGVHLHVSFTDLQGNPVTFDASRPGRLSKIAGSFAAGVIRHLPALAAFTAPSVLSYMRLVPHHWSAAFTCLGEKNREATLRICPTLDLPGSDPAKQFNMEYRAADACASPHLSLAVVLKAGLEGIRAGLEQPPLINSDPSNFSMEEQVKLGIRRLPSSLSEALDTLAADETVTGWFSKDFLDCYFAMKRKEIEIVGDLSSEALCARYASVY